MDELILLLLGRLTEQDITALQEGSLSNADRLELAHREHVKSHGTISMDAFLGKILKGEISAFGSVPDKHSTTHVEQ